MPTINEPTRTNAEQDWKVRYRELSRELDHDRADWTQRERSLVQAVLKFAQCFESIDSALDRQLTALRGNLRGTSDAKLRAALLQEVVDACVAAARRRNDGGDAARGPLEQLLTNLSIPPSAAFEFKQIQSRLKAGEDPLRLANLLAGALNDLSSAALARTGNIRTAAFEAEIVLRLLDDLAQEPTLREAMTELRVAWQAESAAIPRRALGATLAERLRAAVRETGTVRTADADENPSTNLLQLLDWLLLPSEFDARSQKLRESLAARMAPDPIRETGSFLNDLHAFLRRDVRTLEEYLKQASANLNDIDSEMRAALDHSRAVAADSNALTRGISVQMDAIDAAVSAEQQTTALRSLVERRLATIRSTMSTYLGMQQSKQQAYEQRIADLTQRVQAFEAESTRLRQNLEAEHARAHRDTLTLAPNRLAYEERGPLEIKRAQRNNAALCLAVFDLDHFKKINDSFGHKAGDKLLRYTASIALKRIRATDLFARYGGEEFVALFPDTELPAALEVCEELRRQIAASNFHYKGAPVPVSVSIGVARLAVADSLGELFERADRALYRAKHAGRNRVEAAD